MLSKTNHFVTAIRHHLCHHRNDLRCSDIETHDQVFCVFVISTHFTKLFVLNLGFVLCYSSCSIRFLLFPFVPLPLLGSEVFNAKPFG